MRIIFLLTLLTFPVAEIWILINLAHQYGWWVLLYLVVMALLGLQLIRDEKLLFSGRMMQNLNQGGNPIKAIFGSARNIIAGILLIIPGLITDLIAVFLLLIPVNKGAQEASGHTQKPANDDVIEGEFHREE
ncbi:MAG: FxsA family protein [Methylotenera sp.]|nr:FxsA family protein [Methylotenera sp.]MSP99761.1 FxsA family protein [Methylotenera sp.]